MKEATWHDNKQKYFTPFGFSTPVGKCKNSSFANGRHRVALFPIEYIDDGLSGYRVRRRCVNCGKWIGDVTFMISRRNSKVDKCIEGYKLEG